MSDSCLIEIRLKPDAVDCPTDDEIELLASVLPELVGLMQQMELED